MQKLFKLLVLASISTMVSLQSKAQDGMAPLIRNQNIASNSNSEGSIERYAISGRKSIFGHYYSVKLNCTPAEWTEVTMIQEPAHGKAKLVDQMTTMQYAKNNPRSSCNGKSIKSKALEYTPDKDYKGSDQIIVELVNDGGQLLKFDYRVTVK